MSEKPYNGDVSLEARVRVLESQLEERQKAVTLATESLEKRLFLLNELRGDVLTKDEYNQAHAALIYRLEKVELTQSRLIGVGITFVAVAGLIGAVLSHLFHQ